MTATPQTFPDRQAIDASSMPIENTKPGPTAMLRELLHALGEWTVDVDSAIDDQVIGVRRVRRGACLLSEGAPSAEVCVLRSGSAKCVRIHEDGYEQVLSFVHPGELLGFEALHCGRQPASIVALEDVTAFVLPVCALRGLRQRYPVLDQALQLALSRQLVRVTGTAEMMAAVSADARLARFLLWLSQRMQEMGHSPRRLLLRMSRRDIASVLAVAHETISRSLTVLAEAGLVKVAIREIEILDADGLRDVARSTRRSQEEIAEARRTATAAMAPPGAGTARLDALSQLAIAMAPLHRHPLAAGT